MKVERLTEKHYNWFVEVAAVRMLTEEVGRPELVNMSNLYRLGRVLLEQEVAIIALDGDKPVGALGAMRVPSLYNPDILQMAELFWWVAPEYRKGRAGLMLLKEYDNISSELVDEASLSLLMTSEVSIAGLERRGFKLTEYSFRKEY